MLPLWIGLYLFLSAREHDDQALRRAYRSKRGCRRVNDPSPTHTHGSSQARGLSGCSTGLGAQQSAHLGVAFELLKQHTDLSCIGKVDVAVSLAIGSQR